MQYWQYEYLREADTMTRNDTYQIDLPENGLLSAIEFRISAAGVSGAFAATDKWRLSDYISKIEIIGNGSEVIASLTGNCLQGIQMIDHGGFPIDYWHSYATGTKRFNVIMLFGRKLYDLVYGLDLSKWNNVEIKVTNDATSTEFGADFAISTLCYYLRGDATPFSGFLKVEEWRKWTTVSAEIKYLEMPTEELIRRIMLQVIPARDSNNKDKSNMFNYALDLDFSLKTGIQRIYKGGSDDIARMNALFMGFLPMTLPQYYLTADKGRYIGLGYVLGGAWGSGSRDGAGSATIPTLEGSSTNSTQLCETYEADSPIQGIHYGLAPENIVFFPFYLKDNDVSYLDPREEETVKLNVETRSGSDYAGGTIRCLLERLVLK